MPDRAAKAVFLDRDGTLIQNLHYGSDPLAIRLEEGVGEGLRLLKQEGFLLVVVTNQSGVARGYFTEEHVEEMNRRLAEMLEEEGASLDGIYYCPHHPDGGVPHYSIACECRKPQPGMIRAASADLGIDPAQSWMVGDILDDIEAGNRVGCRGILVDVGTEGRPENPEREPEYIARDFLDAARYLLRISGRTSPRREAAVG